MNSILNEKSKEPLNIEKLRENGVALELTGISNGEEVTIYIFKHTNNKFYYLCPQKIIKLSSLTKYMDKDGSNGSKNVSFASLNYETQLKISRLVNSHSYYVKMNQLRTSSRYGDDIIINLKSKIKLDLFVTDNNKNIYEDIPTYFDKVVDYNLIPTSKISPKAYGTDIIKQCLEYVKKNDDGTESPLINSKEAQSSDSNTIHKESDPTERMKILKTQKEFYYETEDNERILIHKDKDKMYCYLDDDSNPKLCDIDDNGYLKVLL